MVVLYLAACIFLGYRTEWWIGAAGFFLSWALSFGVGLYLVAKSDRDPDRLDENAATKHVVLLGGLLCAAFFL